MPTARSEITSAAMDNKIYAIGGFENGRSPTSTVEVYDPITNKWSIAVPLPQPLDHTAAASYNGKMYVVGGDILIGIIYQTNCSSMTHIPTNGPREQTCQLPVVR